MWLSDDCMAIPGWINGNCPIESKERMEKKKRVKKKIIKFCRDWFACTVELTVNLQPQR